MRVLDDWLLTSARAAIHVPTATAVVADVHLGYGEARHRGGDAVPGQCVASILAPLLRVLKMHRIRRLLVAGDLFEAGPTDSKVTELRGWCASADIKWFGVVPGNHDRGLSAQAPELQVYPDGVTLGNWCVVHGDKALPSAAVIQGHEHPVARWNDQAAGPCFLVAERRLILPSFSPDAAGVNVIRCKRWSAYRCCVIAGERLLDFGRLGELKVNRLDESVPRALMQQRSRHARG